MQIVFAYCHLAGLYEYSRLNEEKWDSLHTLFVLKTRGEFWWSPKIFFNSEAQLGL